MKDDRRAFLRTVGGVSAAVAGASALSARADALSDAASPRGEGGLSPAAIKPSLQPTNFALELEGILIGLLRGFSGGNASAEVVQEEGFDCVVRKSLANVHYAELALSLATLPGPGTQDWIFEMLSCGSGVRSGAISSLDANFKEVRRLEFRNALLTEVSLPALDGSAAKEPFSFTLRCQPESTQKVKGSGEKIKIPVSKVKAPMSGNFSLVIDGLDTTRVSRLAGLKFTRGVLPALSEGKAFSIPGKIDVSDLAITLLESSADTWSEWHQSFVIDGKNGKGAEKSASIELLAPNLKSTLFAVHLGGLGIYDLESLTSEAGKEQNGKVVARMYCEEIGFKF